jgi:hypothetical protein
VSRTALQQRPVSPRTRQQQQSRLWSILVLLLALGPLALVCGALLRALARAVRRPRAYAWLALGGVLGLGVLAWQWRTLLADILALRDAARPLAVLLRPTPQHQPSLAQLMLAIPTLWPPLWRLWRIALLLAPMIASYLHSAQVLTAEQLERERLIRQERAAQAALRAAQTRAARAPLVCGEQLVLGVPLGGDLDWARDGLFTYPAAILARHLVLIGASGSGKTETCKRLAAGAAQSYDWQVFYLDCKGDDDTAVAFLAAMRAAGRTRLAQFPEQAYDGWRGDATALLNRLLMVLDFSEPYYRDLTRMLLSLAIEAPPGLPRSSAELLERLNLDELAARYAGRPEARELGGMRTADAQAVYNRYRAFFRALEGGLDGGWAFEDVEGGYILLRGLTLKDQTASLGRYLLEDFAHYVSNRKAKDKRVLLIVDEFPAIAVGGGSAASLFEMVRFHGAAIAVTAQSYAGLGEAADRILGAAAGLIVHQCADPERLLTRAGQRPAFQRRISFTERGLGAAVKEYAIGEGQLAAEDALAVDPNAVKQLGPGACVVIAGGRAQHVLVSPVATAPGTPTRSDAPTVMQEIDRAVCRIQRRVESNTTEPSEGLVEDPQGSSPSEQAAAAEPIRELE